MYNALLVAVSDRLDHLPEDITGEVLFHRTREVHDDVAEVVEHLVHDEDQECIVFERAVELDDVFVIHQLHHGHFAARQLDLSLGHLALAEDLEDRWLVPDCVVDLDDADDSVVVNWSV